MRAFLKSDITLLRQLRARLKIDKLSIVIISRAYRRRRISMRIGKSHF